MPFHRGYFACKAIPSCSATVVVVTYDANVQLQNTIITGPRPSFSYSLPGEGVYILYRNRGIQVAGPSCDRRGCNCCQICWCDAGHFPSSIIKQPPSQPGRNKRPCHDCLVNWMHLYEAAEIGYMAGMSLFAVPRTLTWARLFGNQAFYYDADLEENCTLFSYEFPISSKTSRACSPHLFGSMVDGWKDFLSRGSYKPGRSIITIPDSEDDSDDDLPIDYDWHDCGVPFGDNDTSHMDESCDNFDLIDDLIEEEFPKLKKSRTNQSIHGHVDHRYASMIDDAGIHEDEPAPIIPPKNMVIGQHSGQHGQILTAAPEDIRVINIRDCEWGIRPDRLPGMEFFCGRDVLATVERAWRHAQKRLRPSFTKSNLADLSVLSRVLD
ncbi:hypothetical protein F5X99DRAFT_404881 [Biscogniauxia marginata]|nr:hypothetical protein F5X99DRAFT_404881 [Biscogniauxia marginata]